MAISIIQRQTASQSAGTSFPLAFAANVTAGDGLIALIALGSATAMVSSVTDSRGNIWSKAIGTQAQSRDAEIWYALNAAAGATTVTLNLSASVAAALETIEASSIATSATLDRTANMSGSSKSPATGTTAATAQASELAIGFVTTGSLSAPSSGPTNSFTALTNITTNVSLFGAYQVEGSIGTFSTGWTLGTTTGWNGVIATFKAAAVVVTASSTDTTTAGANVAAGIVAGLSRAETGVAGDAETANLSAVAAAFEIAQSNGTPGCTASLSTQTAVTATGTDLAAANVQSGPNIAEGTTVGSFTNSAVQLGSTALDALALNDAPTRSAIIGLQAFDAAITTLESLISRPFVPADSVEAGVAVESAGGLISLLPVMTIDVVAAHDAANIRLDRFGDASDMALAGDATSVTSMLSALAREIADLTDTPVARVFTSGRSLDVSQVHDVSDGTEEAAAGDLRIATTVRCIAPIECTIAQSQASVRLFIAGAKAPIAVALSSVLSPPGCRFTQAREPHTS